MKIKNWLLIIVWSLVIGYWSISSAAPVISNDEVVSISDDLVVITWQTTNEASTGGIKYGISLPVSAATYESSANTCHYVTIRNLSPNTTYFFKVVSQSAAGTTESILKAFKTLEQPSGNLLFTFATLSDIHYAPNRDNTVNVRGRPYNSSEAIVNDLVSNINQFSPAFTVIKGDMIDAGTDLAVYPVATSLKPKLDNLNANSDTQDNQKYFPIPGNHDKYPHGGGYNWVTDDLGVLYPAKNSLPAGNSTFNYSFDYRGYRFIFLDSSLSDGVTAEVNIASLEAELQAARDSKQKAFIFMHHEATEEPDIPNDLLAAVLDQTSFEAQDWDKIRIRNGGDFFDLLRTCTLESGEPVVASVFMGHIHDNRRRDFYGIPFVRTSSGLQFPTGFNIYKIYSNGYIQTFFKLPGFSEEISRDLITGTGEVTQSRAQQFYLGGLSYRNFTHTYSSLGTDIPPTVSSTQPLAGATDVALNQPIIINFTKPMSKETTVSDWLTIAYDGTNVSYSSSNWSWNSGKTQLTVTLSLAASKTYTVTILGGAAGATATDGTTFTANYPFAFTAGTQSSSTPPAVSIDRIRNDTGAVTDVTTDPTPTFTGTATDESGSTVSNVEFRYDVSENDWSGWYPTAPLDGAFNSPTERFNFSITAEVTRGDHKVQLRASNAAGITTTGNYYIYTFYLIGNKPEMILKADSSTIVNGDPIHPNPSFEVTVITDQTLDQLWLTVDTNRVNIKPANASFVTTAYYLATLADGTHNVRAEAIDRDSLGNTRSSTREAVGLLVQTTGDVRIYGVPLNYPNPFNAGSEDTAISYLLSRNSNITLSIHDLSGTTIAKKTYSTGSAGGRAGYNEVAWDGRSDAGDVAGNGIYVYLIIADGKVVSRGKLTVLKR